MNTISQLLSNCLRPAVIAVCAASLVGCVSVKLPAPTAAVATVEALRAVPLSPAKVGRFQLAAGLPASMDTSVGGLRGASLNPPDGSFAAQLRDQLVTDLKAAGLYNETAPIVIEGQLTDSKVDAAIGTGTGRLAARFTVVRAGKQVYDKEVVVEASWESSFMGAVALPLAINRYTSFYQELTRKLFDDPAFRAALAP